MQAETYYHIYHHANGVENLFCSSENYRYFLRQWIKYIEPVADSYAYCLMPNHFHFLIRTLDEAQVLKFLKSKDPTLQGFETLGGFSNVMSRQFSHLFNSYSQAFNKMYNRRGSLFISNFKQKEIANDAYLTTIIMYIHRNPIHHHFRKCFDDWPHSSYPSILSNKTSRLRKREVLDWFGGKEAFEDFHTSQLNLADHSLFIDY
ncbi:hypothetical protein N7E81_02500 [Reichenbachiella carrageenanivorans]|uniref:Transposase IS200-like domain-containing protein n=1 Tax=Reichenbachiella carrageenanivorans TaxID=2979869 RepID=A0ABY6D1C8_9BACT|nr:transposase [Reichenbachiella carrageenanivorans]UXX79975.1 hypothetical protein N7E81_02500 [Reichenbachiella carrageenanivorans]